MRHNKKDPKTGRFVSIKKKRINESLFLLPILLFLIVSAGIIFMLHLSATGITYIVVSEQELLGSYEAPAIVEQIVEPVVIEKEAPREPIRIYRGTSIEIID